MNGRNCSPPWKHVHNYGSPTASRTKRCSGRPKAFADRSSSAKGEIYGTGGLTFPGYDQEGWVRCQGYATADWPLLVELWAAYNPTWTVLCCSTTTAHGFPS